MAKGCRGADVVIALAANNALCPNSCAPDSISEGECGVSGGVAICAKEEATLDAVESRDDADDRKSAILPRSPLPGMVGLPSTPANAPNSRCGEVGGMSGLLMSAACDTSDVVENSGMNSVAGVLAALLRADAAVDELNDRALARLYAGPAAADRRASRADMLLAGR